MKILGILNITGADSFSDGGEFLAADAALDHARRLARRGRRHSRDIGAVASSQSRRRGGTRPTSRSRGLRPSWRRSKRKAPCFPSTHFRPLCSAGRCGQGVDYLNDIEGFSTPALYPALAASSANAQTHRHAFGRGAAARRCASRFPPGKSWTACCASLRRGSRRSEQAGIARERLILDPGMGLFLGTEAEASRTVLRRLPDLKAAFGLPVLVSVSRKSFLRPKGVGPRARRRRPRPTLAAEIFCAVAQGADYIRTHDPAALRGGRPSASGPLSDSPPHKVLL